MSEIMFVLGIAVLIMCSMGYYAIFKVSSELSLVYSILTLIAITHISGLSFGIRQGIIIYCLISIALFVFYLVRCKDKGRYFSFGIVSYIFMSLIMLFAFHGDYIQTYDDFHQWAAEVKYMFVNNHIPLGSDFVGSASMPPETSLFVAFFQFFGGYNEGHMYTASFMLTAAAAVVPLMCIGWKKWINGVVYLVLVYSGLFTLYNQPYKSMYVDLPVAVWAGATCIAFSILINEWKFKKSFIAIFPMLLFIPRIKWGVGAIIFCFAAGYVILLGIINDEDKVIITFVKRKRKAIIALVLAAVCAFIIAWLLLGESFIPANLSGIVEALTFSTTKAQLTAKTLIKNLFKKSLTSNPNMPFCTVQTTIMFLVVLLFVYICSDREKGKRKIIFTSAFFPIAVVLYSLGLYVSYVSVFSYDESIRNATGYRYLSIVIVYEFIILCGYLAENLAIDNALVAGENGTGRVLQRKSFLLSILLCLLMLCNLNPKIVYKASSRHYWKNPVYSVIDKTKKQVNEIQDYITEGDRVYLISNKYSLESMNEYPLCVALYYMDNQVSNYLREPWEYSKDGSITFVASTDNTIDEFGDRLRQGGYTYVWVHSYNNYLKNEFLERFSCEITENGLYRIIYEDDGSIRMELAKGI